MKNVIEIQNLMAGKNAKPINKKITLPQSGYSFDKQVALVYVSYDRNNNRIHVNNNSMRIEEMRALANAMLEICNKAEASSN